MESASDDPIQGPMDLALEAGPEPWGDGQPQSGGADAAKDLAPDLNCLLYKGLVPAASLGPEARPSCPPASRAFLSSISPGPFL